MQIQGMWQNVAAPLSNKAPLADRNESIDQPFQTGSIDKAISEPPKKTINMHNISPNEYNELVRTGVADLPVPMIFPGGRLHLDGRQAEMGDVKTDYIAQIEQAIKFNQSIKDYEAADFLLSRLDAVKNLHGGEFSPRESSRGIDLTA